MVFKEARNSYLYTIRTAKKAFWNTFLEEASGKDVYTAYAYTKARTNPILPTIRYSREGKETLATGFNDKCEAFITTLFPAPKP
jgi:hypothetical protein